MLEAVGSLLVDAAACEPFPSPGSSRLAPPSVFLWRYLFPRRHDSAAEAVGSLCVCFPNCSNRAFVTPDLPPSASFPTWHAAGILVQVRALACRESVVLPNTDISSVNRRCSDTGFALNVAVPKQVWAALLPPSAGSPRAYNLGTVPRVAPLVAFNDFPWSSTTALSHARPIGKCTFVGTCRQAQEALPPAGHGSMPRQRETRGLR